MITYSQTSNWQKNKYTYIIFKIRRMTIEGEQQWILIPSNKCSSIQHWVIIISYIIYNYIIGTQLTISHASQHATS
jgi:hypothetical protein